MGKGTYGEEETCVVLKCPPSLPPQRFLLREQKGLAQLFLPGSQKEGRWHKEDDGVEYLLRTFKKMSSFC